MCLGYDETHVCHNNCMLLRKRYTNLDACPKCKASRWGDKDDKRIAQKVPSHFPQITRLKKISLQAEQLRTSSGMG